MATNELKDAREARQGRPARQVDLWRQVDVMADDPSPLVLESTQFDFAITVVDDGGLGEGQLVELARVGQVRRQDAQGRD